MMRRKRLAAVLVLLAVASGIAYFAADAAMRRALIAAGESATGARIEIGGSGGSIILGQITLQDVRLTDPQQPGHDLLEIGEVALDLDTAALVERKLVAESASLTGLRLGGPSDGLWALPEKPGDAAGARPRARLAQLDEAWLAERDEAFWAGFERGSESLRRVRQLAERWPGRLEQLECRAASLAVQAAAARETLERDANVLRSEENLREAAAELQTIRREIAQLGDEIERLVRASLADREALARLLQCDRQRLDESLRLDPLPPDVLADYLLGSEVESRVEGLVAWLRWVRKLGGQAPAARGVQVATGETDELPDFLIHGATLSGEAELLGHAVRFQGHAWGITSQPEQYGGPTLIDVQTEGGAAMRIRVGIDRTGPVARQRLAIDCPRLSRERLVLGNPEQLSLAAASGTMRLDALLDVRGDALFGEITLEQDVRLVEAKLGPAYDNPGLAQRLQAAVAGIGKISAEVEVGGTLERPCWQIRTDLGRRLAGTLDRTIREELEARRAELAARLENRVREQLAAYEQYLAAKHRETAERLRLGDANTRELWQIVARRSGMPHRGKRGVFR
jgi:uncharacterized protein (TIGR03545 family)